MCVVRVALSLQATVSQKKQSYTNCCSVSQQNILQYSLYLNLLQGYGEWETKLHIRPVTKEDVEREYRVQATNTIGQQDYVVRISTSSQPRGKNLALK